MPATRFKHGDLAREVAGNYDRRIEELTEELNTILATSPGEKHTMWRASAEARICDLAHRVRAGDASDTDLSRFSISSPPYDGDDRYEVRNLEKQIDYLSRAKGKALAYVRALAADEDGVVEVYAADLKRIGYGLN